MNNIETQETKIKSMAHEAIYDTVLQILQKAPRGKILDVPAGEGALALRLQKAGFEVFCCDLYPQIFKLKNTEIKFGDLDKSLPYDDRSFDNIVCVEGLEHIENPANAIREFARLLRPGGRLIISTPNIMNIEERLKWLIYGYTSHFKPISKEVLTDVRKEFADIEAVVLHVNPIGYSELRYLLENNNFKICKVYRDKPKSHSRAYFPLTFLIRLINRFNSPAKRKARWSDELCSDEVLLGGNTMIFEAVRND